LELNVRQSKKNGYMKIKIVIFLVASVLLNSWVTILNDSYKKICVSTNKKATLIVNNDTLTISKNYFYK